MDLQISVFLLFILFTAGHSLRCYECNGVTGSCADQTVKTCPSGSSHCVTSTAVVQVGDIRSKATMKDCAPACQRLSANFGVLKTTATCCDTDQCNLQDADPSSNIPNGNKCFSCDGQSCSNIVTCLGTEDRCVKATGEKLEKQLLEARQLLLKAVCLNHFVMTQHQLIMFRTSHVVRGNCVTVLRASPRASCSSAVLCSPTSCCTESSSSSSYNQTQAIYSEQCIFS
ncbi:urokinase plasminogen activator surface receptor-like isoform X1 [Chanodichthys erythropterus]|uniref:urokinase plasminogen activator surface receptor-like isoform X1 n=1 Tax=Chanodichthys erythropterus TaxID=933992 RepID=UPI00351DEE57